MTHHFHMMNPMLLIINLQASDSDKSAGVVALTMFDLRR